MNDSTTDKYNPYKMIKILPIKKLTGTRFLKNATRRSHKIKQAMAAKDLLGQLKVELKTYKDATFFSESKTLQIFKLESLQSSFPEFEGEKTLGATFTKATIAYYMSNKPSLSEAVKKFLVEKLEEFVSYHEKEAGMR